MIRKSLMILAVAGATASAQTGAGLDAAKKTWVGVWEGPVWHDGETTPIGGYRLEIARDSAWHVNIHVITGQTLSAEGREFAPDGAKASWTAALMGNPCKTTALVEGTKLKGETRCGDHGGLSFELTKRD